MKKLAVLLVLFFTLSASAQKGGLISSRDFETFIAPLHSQSGGYVNSGQYYKGEPTRIGSVNYGFYNLTVSARYRLDDAELKIGFHRLSESGRELVLKARIEGDELKSATGFFGRKSVFIRDQNYVELELYVRIASCDGIRLLTLPQGKGDLEKAIQDFETIELERVFRCNFTITRIVRGDEINEDLSRIYQQAGPGDLSIAILDDQTLMLQSTLRPRKWGINLKKKDSPPPRGFDPKATREAVEEFIDLVKKYGDVMIFHSDESRDQIQHAMDQFLEENKPKMEAALDRANAGFRYLSLTEKIATHYAINMAYQYVKYFERLIVKTRKLTLKAKTVRRIPPNQKGR